MFDLLDSSTSLDGSLTYDPAADYSGGFDPNAYIDPTIVADNQSAAESARLLRQASAPAGGDPIMNGDGNNLPVVSTQTAAGAASALQILGSAGKLATQAGTAVGNIQKQLASVGPNFNNARVAASSTNPLSGLSVWWQNAPTTDKLMVGLAIVGILVALRGDL